MDPQAFGEGCDTVMLQTFLLNKENRVIAVGNPVHNLKIWELYMEIIKSHLDK